LYNVDAVIRVPADIKTELAKIIFDETGADEPAETKIRTDKNQKNETFKT